MSNQMLLTEDVPNLGRKGDIVRVKPGFARNFLFPKKLAVLADKGTLRLQQRLKEEREKQALQDKKDSEALAQALAKITVTAQVKVDPEGHMYGSVSLNDLHKLLEDQASVNLEKVAIVLKQPIKVIGTHEIPVKLKEGVTAAFTLTVATEEAMEPQEKEPSGKK